jgi:hypothetical protein
MHPTEFVLVFAWLVLLPVVVGLALLRLWHLRGPAPRTRRFWGTAVVFILVTAAIAFAFVAAGPPWLGQYIGVQDVVIFGISTMWAPFAYVAAALALPLAGWLNHRGTSQ